MGAHNFNFAANFFPKMMPVFSPNFCIFGRQFSDSPQFRGGAIASLPATTPLADCHSKTDPFGALILRFNAVTSNVWIRPRPAV